jgi:hypothetical protein
MNLQETVALIESLRANGVRSFKSHEHTIEFGHSPTPLPKPTTTSPQLELPLNAAIDPLQQKAVYEANAKIKEMVSTMNLTAQQLADKMFPEAEV